MINAPVRVRLFPPATQKLFDFLNYPKVNDATGEGYQGDDIADGGQALNLMDAKVHRFVTAFDNKVANPQFKTSASWVPAGSGWTFETGKPGVAVFSGAGGGDLEQAGVISSGKTYTVIVKCIEYTSGIFTPKCGTNFDGTITSVGITVHEIASNGTAFAFGVPASGGAKFEYMYVLDNGDYRFDLPLTSNPGIDFAIIDGHNLLDAFPASLMNSIKVHHHSSDVFGSSTEILPNRIVAGLLGGNRPFVILDGVDDYGVAPADSSLDIANSGRFSMFHEGELKDISTAQVLAEYWTDANNFYQLYIVGGEIGARGSVRGVTYRFKTSGAGLAVGNHSVAMNYNDGVLTGIYDGVSVGLIDNADSSTGAPASSLQLGRNSGGGQLYYGTVVRNYLINRVYSVSEIKALHDGGEIADQDQWGSGAALSTSTIVDSGGASGIGYGDSGGTFANATATGFDGIVVGAFTAIASTVDGIEFISGRRYGVFFNLNLASGQAPEFGILSAWNGSDISVEGLQAAVNGVNYFEFTCNSTTTGVVRFKNTAATNFQVTLFKPALLGVVASYTSLGLSESQGMTFDDTDNGNNITWSGVQYLNTSNPDKLGFSLLQFDTVLRDLFWYLSINKDNDLPVTLQKYGQWIMGKSWSFNISAQSQYGGEMGFSGVELLETKSGRFDALVNYEERDQFVIPLAFQSDATWLIFQQIIKDIGGQELPFYMEQLPLNAGDDSVFYRLRLTDNSMPFSYVFGSGVPWHVGLSVVVDL